MRIVGNPHEGCDLPVIRPITTRPAARDDCHAAVTFTGKGPTPAGGPAGCPPAGLGLRPPPPRRPPPAPRGAPPPPNRDGSQERRPTTTGPARPRGARAPPPRPRAMP